MEVSRSEESESRKINICFLTLFFCAFPAGRVLEEARKEEKVGKSEKEGKQVEKE